MNISLRTIIAAASALALASPSVNAADWTSGMKEGPPEIKSMGALAFGPEGILFVADPKSAVIFAIATGDTEAVDSAKPIKVAGINTKLASQLGVSADQVLIDDLAVNPLSRNAYLAVSRGRGPDATSVLFRVKPGGDLEMVSLDGIKYSKAAIPDPPEDKVVGEGRRQSNPRQESITDIAFLDDRVLVAGLSNEEFASTLRGIPFPFEEVDSGTSVEIFHGAHGRFETRSPVRTFVPFNIGEEPHLLAAYTCTPLVQFPVKRITPGAKIKGKTIAELGNRNRPLDMIVYQKGGKDYLLIANSSRGMMKIDTAQIAGAENIEEKVDGTEGVSYDTLEDWEGITQLDRLDETRALVVREADGAQTLESLSLP